jgi:hypothetical protein
MPAVHLKTVLATALFAAACSQPGLAQAPAAILQMELENVVTYKIDTSDLSRFGTNPSATPTSGRASSCLPGDQLISFGDIVAVNSQPAKGTYVSRRGDICLTPTPAPGQGIANTSWNAIADETYEILPSDGSTPVGTLMTYGLASGFGNQNLAIVGGTGAFSGARGYTRGANSGLSGGIPVRLASIAEDPANRRQNGGGHVRSALYLIPISRPEIVTASSGPAVFHADFSPVTTAKPAKASEVLIVQATGLGPTIPGVDLGQPFPTDALQQVNSPVVVTVNGKSGEVINKIGWPGLVDTYRVDFRMPDGATAGTATIQLTAAWIPGPSVNIPVQ